MSRARLPPGPWSRMLNTARYLADPVAALRRWRARYGDTFTLRDLASTMVVTCDPALIQQLLAPPPGVELGAVAPPSFDVLLGSGSLLLLAGEDHRRARRQLLAPLCRSAMPRWLGVIEAATREVIETLEPGAELSALERMRALTGATMSRIVFGPGDPAEPELRAAARETMARAHPSLLVTRATQLDGGRLTRFGRFMRASDRLDRLIHERIARERSSPGEDSVVAALVATIEASAAGDQAIRDQLRTLLVGGQEATSATMAWALDYLHRDPSLLDEARQVARAAPDTASLVRAPLLAAIVDETLRIRPPAGQLFRTLRTEARLGPWRLPAGTIVSPAPVLLHHREDLWPAPARFDPGRFRRARPRPATYLGFGAGSRRCLGASLGKTTAVVALGTMLRELELELLGEVPTWGRDGIALSPQPGVEMRLRRRLRAPGS